MVVTGFFCAVSAYVYGLQGMTEQLCVYLIELMPNTGNSYYHPMLLSDNEQMHIIDTVLKTQCH